jgi:hypothetical protein
MTTEMVVFIMPHVYNCRQSILLLHEPTHFKIGIRMPDTRQSFISIILSLLLLTLSARPEASQDSDAAKVQNEYDEIVVVKLRLEEPEAGEFGYRAVGQMGALRPETRYLLKLEVENPFERNIEFTSFKTSLALTNFDFEPKVFKAKSVSTGTLVYITPDFATKGELLASFSLMNRGASPRHVAANVTIHGELQGVIDIGRARRDFEVTNDCMEFEIPVFFTAPVTGSELTVETSPPIRDVVTKIEPVDENNATIKFLIPKIVLPETGISGAVTLRHDPTQTCRELAVTFYPALPVILRPNFLRFRKGSLGKLEAAVLIQVHLPAEVQSANSDHVGDRQNEKIIESNSEAKRPPAQLEVLCDYGGRSLDASTRYLANHIWRIKVTTSRNVLQQNADRIENDQTDDGSTIRCRIKVDGKFHEFNLPFLLAEEDFGAAKGLPKSRELTPEEVCSLFEVQHLNGLALTRGDVLVREVQNFDSTTTGSETSGIIVERISYRRAIFDYETGRFACFQIFNHEAADLDAELHERQSRLPAKSNSLRAFVWPGDDEKVFVRDFPGPARVLERSELPPEQRRALKALQFRDFRFTKNTVGLSNREILELGKSHLTADLLNRFEFVGEDEIEVEVWMPFQNTVSVPEGYVHNQDRVQLTRFTRDSGMPLWTVVYGSLTRVSDGTVIETDRKPKEKFHWQTINDIHVLKSINYVENRFMASAGEIYGKGERRVDFHWFSVNEDLDDDLFDESRIGFREEVLKMLDPETTKATSLFNQRSQKETPEK